MTSRAARVSVASVVLIVAVVLTWRILLPIHNTEVRVLSTAAVLLAFQVAAWRFIPSFLALGLIAVTITATWSIYSATTFTGGFGWEIGAVLIFLSTLLAGLLVIAMMSEIEYRQDRKRAVR